MGCRCSFGGMDCWLTFLSAFWVILPRWLDILCIVFNFRIRYLGFGSRFSVRKRKIKLFGVALRYLILLSDCHTDRLDKMYDFWSFWMSKTGWCMMNNKRRKFMLIVERRYDNCESCMTIVKVVSCCILHGLLDQPCHRVGSV